MSPPILIKRIYEQSTKEDGFRVLVDRVWPRGVSKQKASIDVWLKDVALREHLNRRLRPASAQRSPR